MKTIYTAIIARLQAEVPALKWIDMDMGQLDTAERPAVAWPCALVGIRIPKASSITDMEQDCTAKVSIALGFDKPGQTSANAAEANRTAGLAVYDVIADVYKALQGWGTENFDSLDRTSQGDEKTRNGTFKYRIDFATQFIDATAEQ